jgi:hypothetical protein
MAVGLDNRVEGFWSWSSFFPTGPHKRDWKFPVKSCSTLIDALDYNGTCSFTSNIWDSTTPPMIWLCKTDCVQDPFF